MRRADARQAENLHANLFKSIPARKFGDNRTAATTDLFYIDTQLALQQVKKDSFLSDLDSMIDIKWRDSTVIHMVKNAQRWCRG